MKIFYYKSIKQIKTQYHLAFGKAYHSLATRKNNFKQNLQKDLKHIFSKSTVLINLTIVIKLY